jgi:hypothetical protein
MSLTNKSHRKKYLNWWTKKRFLKLRLKLLFFFKKNMRLKLHLSQKIIML